MGDGFKVERKLISTVFRDRDGEEHIAEKIFTYDDIDWNKCVKIVFLDGSYITITEEAEIVAQVKERGETEAD